MNFSDLKSYFSLPRIDLISFIFISLFILAPAAQAADIQAELDSHDGTSGFSFQNSLSSQVARVDSNGNLTTQGNVGVGTSSTQTLLDVSTGGVGPLYTGAGDAFIQNNLEVSGNLYINDVMATGGYTQTGSNINIFNGNVGIGTSPANSMLSVLGGASFGSYATIASPVGGLIASGNIGIGSIAPGQALDVQGVIRSTGLTMSGQAPVSGYVLTASDSAGDTTWTSAGTVGGWTVSGNNVYETNSGNVGIGTVTVSQGALVVTNGNVGIGTWAPIAPLAVGANAFLVNSAGAITATGMATSGGYVQTGGTPNTLTGTTTFNSPVISAAFIGNVGIGSTAPGQTLDVEGTVRAYGLTMSGQSPMSGYVLTASDSSGDTTWTSAGTVGGWTVSGNNVYETNSGNVGIGTVTVSQGALVVTNGNVGIGTWAPSDLFAVGANVFTVNNVGAITATGMATSGGYVQTGVIPNTLSGITAFTSPVTSATFTGNVGIGSTAPGQTLDVQGTVRASGLAMSGQAPVSGYVLTASDSSGDATWTSAGTVGGWTVSGNNVYETNSGNVGIGTVTVSQGALVVTNGNVGIGTWAPTAPLAVGANAFLVNSAGAITATGMATSGGYVQTGVTPNTLSGTTTFSSPLTSAMFTGNVGIGSTSPGQSLDVQGTVRTAGFALTGQAPVSGYVLTSSDSSGDATWSSAGGISGWTVSGNNVYETSSGNVGIGTTALQTALAVTNGNVGIGTWTAAGGNLIIKGGGNVGIGTAWPGQMLDVAGTVRNFGEIVNGNVGIGTSALQTAFAVTNGNVGIGTWSSSSTLTIFGSIAVNTVSTSALTYAAATTDQIILANAATNNVTVDLPAASTVPGREYVIKKTDPSAFTVIIQANAAENIDGQNTVSINGQYQSYTLVCDGTRWNII